MSQRIGSLGCIGWSLIWIGIVLLFFRFWDFDWAWIQTVIGGTFLYYVLRDNHHRGMLFPATILLATGSTMLFWEYGIIQFNLWKLWAVFFGSTGLALTLLWTIKHSGRWILIPGSLLMLAGGAGIGAKSWWDYQLWLRNAVDWWPMILILFGIIIALSAWKSRSSTIEEKNFISS